MTISKEHCFILQRMEHPELATDRLALDLPFPHQYLPIHRKGYANLLWIFPRLYQQKDKVV